MKMKKFAVFLLTAVMTCSSLFAYPYKVYYNEQEDYYYILENGFHEIKLKYDKKEDAYYTFGDNGEKVFIAETALKDIAIVTNKKKSIYEKELDKVDNLIKAGGCRLQNPEEAFDTFREIVDFIPFCLAEGTQDIKSFITDAPKDSVVNINPGICDININYYNRVYGSDVFGIPRNKVKILKSFQDVKPNQWYYKPIMLATNYGYMSIDSTYFNPTAPVTIGEAVEGLDRVITLNLDNTVATGRTYIEDLLTNYHKDEAYYHTANILQKMDLDDVHASFIDLTKYKDRPITRLEISKLIYKVFKGKNLPATLSLTHFTDTADTAPLFCVNIGVMSGYKDGSFGAYNIVSRAELATILENCSNLYN